MTPDPANMAAAHPGDPQTWNMYAYVRNNPTTLNDPSGLEPADEAGVGDPNAMAWTERGEEPESSTGGIENWPAQPPSIANAPPPPPVNMQVFLQSLDSYKPEGGGGRTTAQIGETIYHETRSIERLGQG